MNRSKNLVKLLLVGLIGMFLSLGILNCQRVLAEDEEQERDSGALLRALSQSQVSLSDGIKKSTKGAEVPISAKYELDEKDKLSLSVYTAEKGLNVDPQSNTFKEISGSPVSATWNPEAEVIKDEDDVKAAKEQLTVLSKAKVSLLDIVEKAAKENQGTVFAATPEMEDNKSVIEVKVAKDDNVSEHHYDIASGNEIKMEDDDQY